MSYQHSILPEHPHLEVQVLPEVHGYWTLKYRSVDARFAHRDDWRAYEHLTEGELLDVYGAVMDGFQADYAAQQAF